MGLNPSKTTNVLLLPIVLALVSSSLIIDEGLRSAVTKAFHEFNYSTVILSLSPNQLAFLPVVLGAFLVSLKLGGRWLSQNRGLVTKVLALVMVLMLASQPILLSSALSSHEREDSTSTLETVAEKIPQIKGIYKGTDCVACHTAVTPKIVEDWNMSKHAKPTYPTNKTAYCDSCHGQDHERLIMPTEMPCKSCHPQAVETFDKGKHHYAWLAMDATRGLLKLPDYVIWKGCGACHRIGSSGNTTDWGVNTPGVSTTAGAKCDSCHTRHRFDVAEARKPEACYTCHMGFDHPQYEMFLSSRHGLIYTNEGPTWNFSYKSNTEWPYKGPVCVTCHMERGNHTVITPWGYLAVAAPGVGPFANDTGWSNDNVEILKALAVLTPDGKPGFGFEVVKNFQIARLSPQEFDAIREHYMQICKKCHSTRFVENQFQNYDAVVKETTRLMAEAIRETAELYREGLIKKQGNYPYDYPLLLSFYNASTPIEQTLWVMFLERRNKAFMGSFHENPDYMHWDGYGPMREDLVRIKAEADSMRATGPVKAAETGLPIPEIAAAAATIIAIAAIVVAARAERKARKTPSDTQQTNST